MRDTAGPAPSRIAHTALIMLIAISLWSGYSAFDLHWSGVGVFNRPTYYMAHQTAGLLIPIVVLFIGWSLVRRTRFKLQNGLRAAGMIEIGALVIHWLLLTSAALIALLGIAGTYCAGYYFSFVGIVLSEQGNSHSCPATVLALFNLHKEMAWALMILVCVHALGALLHAGVLRDGRLTNMFRLTRIR